MQVKAHLSQLRISPRKVRLVADAIRGLDVRAAKVQLEFLIKRSSPPLLKLLNSATANATHNFKLNPDALYISEIFVNEGPSFKRGIPQSRGRVHQIRKRTSHVSLILEERKKEERKNIKTKGESKNMSKKNKTKRT